MRNTMTCLLQCSVSNVFRQALINVKVSLKFSSISNKTCSWLWLKVLHPSSSFWVSWGIQLGSVQFFQVTQMYRRVLLKLHLNTSYNQVHTLKEEKKTWKKNLSIHLINKLSVWISYDLIEIAVASDCQLRQVCDYTDRFQNDHPWICCHSRTFN